MTSNLEDFKSNPENDPEDDSEDDLYSKLRGGLSTMSIDCGDSSQSSYVSHINLIMRRVNLSFPSLIPETFKATSDDPVLW